MRFRVGIKCIIGYHSQSQDTETTLYYLQSRYYNPALGRFICSDVAVSTGQGLTGNNTFAYCGNNPVARVDYGGDVWETIWDIASLVSSVAEVVAKPTDPWAWAGLIGDVIDVALPGVGGLGEAVDATKTTVRVIQGADNIVDAAKTFRRTADRADDIKKATGAYVILYKNGEHYIGKGGFKRAIKSATEHMTDKNKV